MTLLVDIQKRLPSYTLEVAFRAEARMALGILGASGSGKSMTLRCIAGIERPDRGRIVLNGRVLYDSDRGINLPSRQRRVGLVFQTYALFPHQTVAENIGFGLQQLPRAERLQRVGAWLAAMQLQGLGDRYPAQLSGGQQQRVALARALAPSPEVLLLDEPLSALDTYLRSQVEQWLLTTLGSYSGVTLFVTHNLEEVFRLCPQIVVMAAGRLVAQGSRHQVFAQPGSAIAAQITGCKNFSAAQPTGPTTILAQDWNCTLTVPEPLPATLSQVGFRAHQIEFGADPTEPNTFSAWLVAMSETPHRITLFLHLHTPPYPGDMTYHLQAEVFKDRWSLLNDQPQPWTVRLAPESVLLLSDRDPFSPSKNSENILTNDGVLHS